MVRSRLKYWSVALILCFLAGSWGCAGRQRSQGANTTLDYQDTQLQSWREGLAAFQSRNYERALESFETVGKDAHSADLRRNALYARACTLLILSQDRKAYREALSAWDLWSRRVPAEPIGEDPRMLSPFLKRIGTSAAFSAEPGASTGGKPDNGETIRGLLQAKMNENENLKSKLDSRQKEIQSLKSQVQSLRSQIRSLKHQIDTLEKIHREIQEKKQEISSP